MIRKIAPFLGLTEVQNGAIAIFERFLLLYLFELESEQC